MRHKIFPPSGFYCGFKGQHQNTGKAHLFSKLIGGEGLAEAHFRIPQEFRCAVRFVFFCRSVILHRALDSELLLRTHFENLCSVSFQSNAGAQFLNGSTGIAFRTFKPFVAVCTVL
jgi:hypothetical protein